MLTSFIRPPRLRKLFGFPHEPVLPRTFGTFPGSVFGDGIILMSIATVLLNASLSRTSQAEAEADTFMAAWAA